MPATGVLDHVGGGTGYGSVGRGGLEAASCPCPRRSRHPYPISRPPAHATSVLAWGAWRSGLVAKLELGGSACARRPPTSGGGSTDLFPRKQRDRVRRRTLHMHRRMTVGAARHSPRGPDAPILFLRSPLGQRRGTEARTHSRRLATGGCPLAPPSHQRRAGPAVRRPGRARPVAHAPKLRVGCVAPHRHRTAVQRTSGTGTSDRYQGKPGTKRKGLRPCCALASTRCVWAGFR